MQSEVIEISTKKSSTPRRRKNTHTDQSINASKELDRQEMIATAAYYRAEKRGFSGNAADTLQDWLEAEMEIDNELNMFNLNGKDFAFLKNKAE